MSIKPILFNGDMVRAILDGRKTVTRRVVKPHNPVKASRMGGYYQGNGLWIDADINNGDSEGHIKDYSVSCTWWTIGEYIKRFASYKPGDILYVRETWQYIDFFGEDDGYVYKASQNGTDWEENTDNWKWRPSIHMPKEAARIWLKVTNVRVERLRDITMEQCVKEGLIDSRGFIHSLGNEYDDLRSPKLKFQSLWDSTVKKEDLNRYGWDANPWVWVIEFERCEKPQEENNNGRR